MNQNQSDRYKSAKEPAKEQMEKVIENKKNEFIAWAKAGAGNGWQPLHRKQTLLEIQKGIVWVKGRWRKTRMHRVSDEQGGQTQNEQEPQCFSRSIN